MRLLFIGQSRESIKVRYKRTAASFRLSGDTAVSPDPATWGALGSAHGHILQTFGEALALERDSEDRQLLGDELRRLIIAGYVLGRIENGTENQPLRFSALAEDQEYEAREFRLATGGCTTAGVERGVFSQRPRRAMSEILAEFSLDAAQTLLDRLRAPSAQARRLTEACARAINLGREIALMEDVYLNPKYRSLVLEIRGRIQKEQAMRLRLAQEGLAPADDVVNQTMRRVIDVISGQHV